MGKEDKEIRLPSDSVFLKDKNLSDLLFGYFSAYSQRETSGSYSLTRNAGEIISDLDMSYPTYKKKIEALESAGYIKTVGKKVYVLYNSYENSCKLPKGTIEILLKSKLNNIIKEIPTPENFYNDTYLFDQNACSAPHLLFWLKEESLEEAKDKFWDYIYEYTARKYNLQSVLSVDKLTEFYREAIAFSCHKVKTKDNLIVRTHLDSLPRNIDEFRCAGGYFQEFDIETISQIAEVVTEKYQTLAYLGFDKKELEEFVIENRLRGLDRIVPFGLTTSFSLTWDGYNLIDTLSRISTIL